VWTLETFKVPVSNGSIGGYDILVCVVVQDKADECRDEMKDLLNGSPVQIRQMEDRSIKLHMFLNGGFLIS